MFDYLNNLGKSIVITFIVSTIILIIQILLEFLIIPLTFNFVGTDWIWFLIVFYLNSSAVIILAILTLIIITMPDSPKRKDKPIKVKHIDSHPIVKRSKSKPKNSNININVNVNAARYIAEAEKYKMARSYKEAIELYELVLDIEPDNVSALSSLGVIYKNQGEYQKSIDVCEKAVNINPKHKFAWNLLGLDYIETKNYDKAIKAYEQALNLDISSKEAAHNLGFAYAKKGQNDSAIDIITAALDKSPKYSQVWYKLAKIYLNTGQTEEALTTCKQSLSLNPNSKDAQNLLKIIQKSVGKDSSSSKIAVKGADTNELETVGGEKYPQKAIEEYKKLGKIAMRGDKFTEAFKKWYEENHNK